MLDAYFHVQEYDMVRAFILIEMAAGYSQALVGNLAAQDGISDVVRVTGPIDVIATIEAPNIEAVSAFVNAKIHSLEGVVRTTTCVALD